MKTILVPVDFSENAANALHFAIRLSQKLQANLVLFHSFHTFHVNPYGSARALDDEMRGGKQYADEQLRQFYLKAGGNPLHTPALISSPNELRDEIMQLVTDKHIDLIVMGTQGAGSKLEGMLFGTNTAWVIEKAPCPVIAIPERLHLDTLSEIVYATDYLPGDVVNLGLLAPVAALFNAHITVIHVAKDESWAAVQALAAFEQQVMANTDFRDISFRLWKGNGVERSLDQYLETNHVDLLVMTAHQRTTTEKLFGKSMTKAMTLHAATPLMVFHQ